MKVPVGKLNIQYSVVLTSFVSLFFVVWVFVCLVGRGFVLFCWLVVSGFFWLLHLGIPSSGIGTGNITTKFFFINAMRLKSRLLALTIKSMHMFLRVQL